MFSPQLRVPVRLASGPHVGVLWPQRQPRSRLWHRHLLALAARSERYRHLGSEDDETNDEESTGIPQFSSCSHRFSKVGRFAVGPPQLVLRERPSEERASCSVLARSADARSGCRVKPGAASGASTWDAGASGNG